MATFYKRYIPPKPASGAVIAPAPVVPASQSTAALPNAPTKRKRERTEDEVAERKAKKLRKKRIDPATVPTPSPVVEKTLGSKDSAPKDTVQVGVKQQTLPKAEPQGEFADINNSKKRHRLQKEARRARKASANSQTEAGSGSQAEGGDGAGLETTSTPALLPDSLEKPSAPGGSSEYKTLKAADLQQVNGTKDSNESRVKRKKRRKNEVDADQLGDGSQESTRELTNDGAGHIEPQPTKRRHKLEGILKGKPDDVPNGVEDDRDHIKKHDGILKKFDKAAKLAQKATRVDVKEDTTTDAIQPTILDLAPLPQPAEAPTQAFVVDAASLPGWIAGRTIVTSDDSASFSDLQLDAKTVLHLSKLGFSEAMPVQKALIPLLLPPGSPGAHYLPGTGPVLPDIAVNAPTGSGKTIAYLLPIIEALKRVAGLGRLRVLIVVPTRELVTQVAAVGESLAKGTSVTVGMSTGTGAFKDEQARLIKRSRRYDPEAYSDLMAKAHRRDYPPADDDEDFDDFLKEMEREDAREEQRIRDTIGEIEDHVPVYESAYDILVATPGRLLEHLHNTLGFSLAHLDWLVLDEADKLLDLQYDGFLGTINSLLSRPRSSDEQDDRERFLRAADSWDDYRERRVRKVVLSATMTKDTSKLVELKLRWPKMIVVRGRDQAAEPTNQEAQVMMNGAVQGLDGDFELPTTLSEHCVPVGDGSEKPLYLVELLRKHILPEAANDAFRGGASLGAGSSDDEEEEDSDTSSQSSSGSDSDSSSSSSSSSEENGEREEHSLRESNVPPPTIDNMEASQPSIHPSRTAMLAHLTDHRSAIPTILIFTSSNEATTRLAHLLRELVPEWKSYITTMARSNTKFPNTDFSKPLITVSTDRAARGLDVLGSRPITHVVQYDVPRSTTAYVHRVGRTARVGRHGEAWTLYAGHEARWFLKDIVKSKTIKRAGEVERVKLTVGDADLRERLGEVVEGMRESVLRRSNKIGGA